MYPICIRVGGEKIKGGESRKQAGVCFSEMEWKRGSSVSSQGTSLARARPGFSNEKDKMDDRGELWVSFRENEGVHICIFQLSIY